MHCRYQKCMKTSTEPSVFHIDALWTELSSDHRLTYEPSLNLHHDDINPNTMC